MTPNLITAQYLDEYRILLIFSDGTKGIVDLKDDLWGEVFEPLKDLDVFRQFELNTELSTIQWSTGADLAPGFLYEQALHNKQSQPTR